MSRARVALLSVFGLGFRKPGPGTWGSLFPVFVVIALLAFHAGVGVVNASILGMLVVFSFACIAFGRWAEQHFGAKDAQTIVADEVAGMCVAMAFIPWQTAADGANWFWWNLGYAGAAFVLFRLFDISKPPPIRQIQDLPRGWGVLIDDIVAGLLASIIWHLAFLLLIKGV